MEAVTGSLGQGLSIAVGMALALRLQKSPAHVCVIMGDGELAEGQLWEAAMAASRYRLDSITGIVDRNRIQATGPTRDIFDIPCVPEKWRAFGWNTLCVDGHDVGALLDALDEAASTKGAPTVIVAETIKGKGVSFAENTATFHNAALTREQYDQALLEIEEARRCIQ
jgi:transketolase